MTQAPQTAKDREEGQAHPEEDQSLPHARTVHVRLPRVLGTRIGANLQFRGRVSGAEPFRSRARAPCVAAV
jgi:hypothetical protein